MRISQKILGGGAEAWVVLHPPGSDRDAPHGPRNSSSNSSSAKVSNASVISVEMESRRGGGG